MPLPLTLKKATIKQIDPPKGRALNVLFNPTEYSVERSVNYAQHVIQGLDMPLLQFVNGTADTLRMNLFFDTYYSTNASFGEFKDTESLGGTSVLLESKKIDVRTYTENIYKMMSVAGDRHAPPLVEFAWGSFSFTGYITSVSEQFTMFTYSGIPVRAKLDVSFLKRMTPQEQVIAMPRNSPDRTKFYTIKQGDTLSAIAMREYNDADMWREIARVNKIENPRLLETGSSIKIPAWL